MPSMFQELGGLAGGWRASIMSCEYGLGTLLCIFRALPNLGITTTL